MPRPPLDQEKPDRHFDASAGLLDSEQSIRVIAPRPSESAWAGVPGRMETLHLEAVQRSVLGLFRCRSDGETASCRLFGRWPGLVFLDPVTIQDERSVTRRWTIGPGFLARRAVSFGSMTLGTDLRPIDGTGVEWHLWAQVRGYPSRFLPAAAAPALVRSLIARLYVAVHERVTRSYLERLASEIRRGGFA